MFIDRSEPEKIVMLDDEAEPILLIQVANRIDALFSAVLYACCTENDSLN